MPGWRILELGIDFGVPGVLALMGVALAYRVGLGKWRRKPARRCFKCGYDMRGSEGLVCVECGWEARSQKEVEHGRVRRWAVGMGVVLCVPIMALGAVFAAMTPEMLKRKAIQEKYDLENPKPVEGVRFYMIPAFGGRWQEAKGDWRRDGLMWVIGEQRYFRCGFGVLDVFQDGVSPTLNPNGQVSPRANAAWRRILFFVGHGVLFPKAHYKPYFPVQYEPVERVTLFGQGDDRVLPADALDELSALAECEYVSLIRVKLDGLLAQTLEGMGRVGSIQLESFAGSSGELAQVCGVTSLRELRVEFSRPVTREDIQAIGNARMMGTLSIGGNGEMGRGTGQALAEVYGRQKIGSLQIEPACRGEEASGLAAAIGHGQAYSLDLNVTGWSEEALAELGKAQAVQSLTIRRTPNEGNARGVTLDWVGSFRDLRFLTVSGFEGESLEGLPGAKNLEHLRVEGRVNEDFVVRVAPKIEAKNVAFSVVGVPPEKANQLAVSAKVSDLSVTGWVPDDAACARLAAHGFSGLAVQDVSENGLEVLMRHGSIKSIKLLGTVLEENVIAGLKVKYPNVTVEMSRR